MQTFSSMQDARRKTPGCARRPCFPASVSRRARLHAMAFAVSPRRVPADAELNQREVAPAVRLAEAAVGLGRHGLECARVPERRRFEIVPLEKETAEVAAELRPRRPEAQRARQRGKRLFPARSAAAGCGRGSGRPRGCSRPTPARRRGNPEKRRRPSRSRPWYVSSRA